MTPAISVNFAPIGQCQTATLKPGFYLLEAWGAQGGNCGQVESGKGIFHNTKENQIITVCVGKQGQYKTSGTSYGGFNGGGNGYTTSFGSCSGGGGGSTDIILGNKSGEKLLIAGAGGGIAHFIDISKYYYGGHAGGLNGGSNSTNTYYGQGATQYNGGKNGYYPGEYSNPACTAGKGSEGLGGNGCATALAGAGGGGGGYYGGGGGADIGSGGGGSGFLNPLLKYANTYSGNTRFNSPTPGAFETGHKGDGYAIITFISLCTTSRKSKFGFSLLFILIVTSN